MTNLQELLLICKENGLSLDIDFYYDPEPHNEHMQKRQARWVVSVNGEYLEYVEGESPSFSTLLSAVHEGKRIARNIMDGKGAKVKRG